jgi:hypothetical protein
VGNALGMGAKIRQWWTKGLLKKFLKKSGILPFATMTIHIRIRNPDYVV